MRARLTPRACVPVTASGTIDSWIFEICCSRSSLSRSAAGLPETMASSVPIASRIESRSRFAAASAHTRYDDSAQSCRSADAGRGGVLSSTSASGGVSADGGAVSQPLACVAEAAVAEVEKRCANVQVEWRVTHDTVRLALNAALAECT